MTTAASSRSPDKTSSSAPKDTTNSSSKTKGAAPYVALWDMEGPALDQWVHSIPALQAASKPSASGAAPQFAESLIQRLWKNLQNSLQALQTKVHVLPEDDNGEEGNGTSEPPSKKSKLNSSKKKKKPREKLELIDPYNLYLHTIRIPNKEDQMDDDDEADDIEEEDPIQEAAYELKTTTGGKLTQLSISGLTNGLSAVKGGVVINKHLEAKEGYFIKDKKNPAPIASAGNATLTQIQTFAAMLHQAIQTRIGADVLITTPIRIQQLLAPDLQPHEFKAVRRRIYDTVILGKGLAQPEDIDIPTGPASGVHDIEKFKKCKSCGNNDQSLFVLDRKNGDVICSQCGTVASESLMHEGSQFRKFEGEADRNHHGDTANPLYSNAHNMSTTLAGVQMTTGAGIGGFGSGNKGGLETILRNAHAYTELNISQFGKGDRRTRIGYKDKQKKDAFVQMAHCGDALNLHEAVVQRAKELFAGFRDDRELIQQFKAVIAACLCEAFDQLSKDGKRILKQKLQEEPEGESGKNIFVNTNARASRRNELHHANLAGKGGLLLDFTAVKDNKDENASSVATKAAATWDLDDCRSWLLEASRSIALQWIDDRKKGVPKIPEGSQEELEGKLVEHAISLCDALEGELRQQALKQKQRGGGMGGHRRVVTPRVNDMSKLGIKWQHSHERGSGGKGGVGNSGTQKAAGRNGRTAGQILILKTAKKLGLMLNDAFAGEAIHKELRGLINQQEAQKRKRQREEATRQRLTQMKRKPWLQARAEMDD